MPVILRIILAGAVWVLALTGASQADGDFDHAHAALDDLLTVHVSSGWVDYRALRRERPKLQAYLGTLGDLPRESFEDFSPSEQLALLINAYNAFTLELILEHYPVRSIRDIPGAWDRLRWRLVGQEVTLNEIEHEWIREFYGDARVHCALVCASRSCPRLLNGAYEGDHLNAQLDRASRAFVRDDALNRLDRDSSRLHISKIFEWYRHDFVARWGRSPVPQGSEASSAHRAVVGFIRDYLPEDEAGYLRDHPVKIAYNEYDWRLNERRTR
jgi:hypothetical protein